MLWSKWRSKHWTKTDKLNAHFFFLKKIIISWINRVDYFPFPFLLKLVFYWTSLLDCHSQTCSCFRRGLVTLNLVHLAIHHIVKLIRPDREKHGSDKTISRKSMSPNINVFYIQHSSFTIIYLDGRSSCGLYSPSSGVPSSYSVLAITNLNLSPRGIVGNA